MYNVCIVERFDFFFNNVFNGVNVWVSLVKELIKKKCK